LEECNALVAPVEPGSTLVVSSVRSESVKGHVTRLGTRIVKGSITLRLKTLPPQTYTISPHNPITLQPLLALRNLLAQSLDCVDVTRWTGDRHYAPFISSQLRLLHSLLSDARVCLRGPNNLPQSSTTGAPNQPSKIQAQPELPSDATWAKYPLEPECFTPPLPPSLSLYLQISDGALLLFIRSLEPANAPLDIGSRLAFAIGAQRRLEHDEMNDVFTYEGEGQLKGEKVAVREKVRVESADPSLLACQAKLDALEHIVGMARTCLGIVMGEGDVLS